MDFLKISDLTEILTINNDNEMAWDVSGALRKIKYSNFKSVVVDEAVQEVLDVLPDEDIDFTGDNTHAGDEEFNGEMDINANMDFAGASTTTFKSLCTVVDSDTLNNFVSDLDTVAHSMGAQPIIIATCLVCETGDSGYSAGDEVYLFTPYSTGRSVTISADGTNIIFGADNLEVRNKTTGANTIITKASWRLRAYCIR